MGVKNFLNGKQYMIMMRISTLNPMIVFFYSVSYIVLDIIEKIISNLMSKFRITKWRTS